MNRADQKVTKSLVSLVRVEIEGNVAVVEHRILVDTFWIHFLHRWSTIQRRLKIKLPKRESVE